MIIIFDFDFHKHYYPEKKYMFTPPLQNKKKKKRVSGKITSTKLADINVDDKYVGHSGCVPSFVIH